MCNCKCACNCKCRRGKAPAKGSQRRRAGRSKRKSGKRNIRSIAPFRVRPVVKRYFFEAPEDIRLTGDSLVLHPGQFSDDAGEPASGFMDFGQDGYFNLYVNGVLQEGKLFKADADKLTIVATGQSILKGTPIILESVGFQVTRGK